MSIKISAPRWPEFAPYLWMASGRKHKSIGLDLEWNEVTKNPSIIGIASGNNCYSASWNEENEDMMAQILGSSEEIVGHNIITGDIPVLCKHMKYPVIPPKKFDTFIYFYLTNAHLCKSRVIADDEQEHQNKGGGYMNIWTMASLYTDLPNWKECRGPSCWQGKPPCPKHNVFWYNALDALAPLMARDKLEIDARLRGVDHLVPMMNRISEIAAGMSEYGIQVDEEYLGKMEIQIAKEKAETLAGLPAEVNWGSWQQVKKFFREKYGNEPETTDEETMQTFFEEFGYPEAEVLLDLKQGGKGLKSWFDKRYIDEEGILHPQFKPVGGTSTGRWASSRPNFQNIPVRRGKHIRKIICARPGCVLYKADYKQAEARTVLYQAGVSIPNDGSFKHWLLNELDLSDWAVTKSFVHAAHYGEGIVLLTESELNKNNYVNMVSKGALDVNKAWKYNGKYVCNTGINLAARIYGSATFDNRKKALDIQRRYFQRFPEVQRWQRSVGNRVDSEGCARSTFGFYLMLYGQAFPKMKTALAMLGSNPVSIFTSLACIRAEEDGHTPIAQVHDELLFEFDKATPVDLVVDKIRGYMEFEDKAMPGFMIPVEVARGKNWGEMEVVYG